MIAKRGSLPDSGAGHLAWRGDVSAWITTDRSPIGGDDWFVVLRRITELLWQGAAWVKDLGQFLGFSSHALTAADRNQGYFIW
jgi:hypothetical protein